MNIIKDVTFPHRVRVKSDIITKPPNPPQRSRDDDIHTMNLLFRNVPFGGILICLILSIHRILISFIWHTKHIISKNLRARIVLWF